MITYITKQNDRWDSIAYEVYGDPYLYEPIMLANPEYMHLLSLPSGLRLTVPLLYDASEHEDVSPSWQRD